MAGEIIVGTGDYPLDRRWTAGATRCISPAPETLSSGAIVRVSRSGRAERMGSTASGCRCRVTPTWSSTTSITKRCGRPHAQQSGCLPRDPTRRCVVDPRGRQPYPFQARRDIELNKVHAAPYSRFARAAEKGNIDAQRSGIRRMAELSGQCSCGTVQYRLTTAPMFVHCCHCTDC